MAKPLNHDLRIRLVAAVEGGMSCRAAARHFGVGGSTVHAVSKLSTHSLDQAFAGQLTR